MPTIRVEEGAECNDDIGGDEQRAFEVVAAPIQDEKIHDESRNEQADGLEDVEVQAHVPIQDPAQQDDDGRDEHIISRMVTISDLYREVCPLCAAR